jgi:hypothetical protein
VRWRHGRREPLSSSTVSAAPSATAIGSIVAGSPVASNSTNV